MREEAWIGNDRGSSKGPRGKVSKGGVSIVFGLKTVVSRLKRIKNLKNIYLVTNFRKIAKQFNVFRVLHIIEEFRNVVMSLHPFLILVVKCLRFCPRVSLLLY